MIATRAGTSARDRELIIGRAQDRAHQRLDALQRPALGERVVEAAVDGELILLHARDDVAEEGELGGVVLIALDLLADPMRLEFGEDVGEALVARPPSGRAPARRRGARRSGVRPCSSTAPAAFERGERQRRARGVAAFVAALRDRRAPRPARAYRRSGCRCRAASLRATDMSISARADSPATISK